MLAAAPFVGFIPVLDLAAARGFYADTLGLRITHETPHGLVAEVGSGGMLRITAVPELTAQPFTIAGWSVSDIVATVTTLAERGVAVNRYDGVEQDEDGIWTTPSEDRVAWFCDPDHNVLSLTEFAARA